MPRLNADNYLSIFYNFYRFIGKNAARFILLGLAAQQALAQNQAGTQLTIENGVIKLDGSIIQDNNNAAGIYLHTSESTLALNHLKADINKAVDEVNSILQQTPKNAKAIQKKFSQLDKLLNNCLELNPADQKCLKLLIQIREESNDEASVNALYKTLLQHDPQNLDALKWLILYNSRQRHTEDVLKYGKPFVQIVETKPEPYSSKTYSALGNYYFYLFDTQAKPKLSFIEKAYFYFSKSVTAFEKEFPERTDIIATEKINAQLIQEFYKNEWLC